MDLIEQYNKKFKKVMTWEEITDGFLKKLEKNIKEIVEEEQNLIVRHNQDKEIYYVRHSNFPCDHKTEEYNPPHKYSIEARPSYL